MTKKQLRGEALQKRIGVVIKEHHTQATKDGVNYIYNATHVAKDVPTTRKTLSKHDDFIDNVIRALKVKRRTSTGNATIEFLRERIKSLKEDLSEKDKIISALRHNHLDIFKILHENSIDAQNLVRPIIEKESKELGTCILCGSKININQ